MFLVLFFVPFLLVVWVANYGESNEEYIKKSGPKPCESNEGCAEISTDDQHHGTGPNPRIHNDLKCAQVSCQNNCFSDDDYNNNQQCGCPNSSCGTNCENASITA